MKIILCAYNWTGCKALDILKKRGYSDIYVATHETPYHIPSLVDLCVKYNIPYTTDNISKIRLPFDPDIIISIYYRFIIKEHLIEKVQGKIFNLHPSLLPKYRGCSSVTWALINGEKEYGFTYHYISRECDAGNIILQKKLEIEEWDTQLSLYNKVMFESMNYFESALDRVLSGEVGYVQKGIASYYKRGCPYNGEINENESVEFIERFIRAMYFPPYKPAIYKGKKIYSIKEYLDLRNLK